MSEFQELIKSFAKSRDYVRDFFVYVLRQEKTFHKKAVEPMTMNDEELKAGCLTIYKAIIPNREKRFLLY